MPFRSPSRRSFTPRRVVAAVLRTAALLVCLGPTGLLLAAPAAAPVATGAVEVLAAPGSSVFVDGRLRGRTDASGALEVPAVPAGERRVLVVHPDRVPADLGITVRPGASARADLTRTEAAPAARIDYDSRVLEVRWDRLDRLPNFLPLLLALLLASLLVFWLSHRLDRWIRGD